MPHILLHACDLERNIEILNIHVHVELSDDNCNIQNMNIKLWELQQKLEDLMEEYFPDFESEIISNHQYDQLMNNY